ncbi:MAG: Mur ligase family protein [Clostridia bacterium]|nr:Mur ligase family protein [Clostridia bacterium]
MLQLNSYRIERYGKWLSENKGKMLALRAIWPALAFAFLALGNKVVFAVFAALMFLLVPFKKKKAKKPLVYTARVKRLIIVYMVLGVAVVAGCFFVKDSIWAPVIFLAAALLVPHIISLALLMAEPMEKGIARHYYNDAKRILASAKDLIIIGVTGSYGKTSMKYIISSLLSEKYNVLMTPGSFNTTMGVVRTVREQLKPTHQVFVVEMGAKNKGDIKEICDLVKPKYGVISSIGPQHLETFKTIENIINTKFELAEAVRENGGKMFLNYSNEYIKGYGFKGEFVSFGSDAECDYRAEGMKYSSSGASFFIKGEELKTSLLGDFSAINIAGGVAVAEHLGVLADDIKVSVRRLKAPEHRLELKKNPRYTVIDDAYNSNPGGSTAALKTLSLFEERKILVTPGMVELGDEEYNLNKEMGRKAAHSADYIVLVGEKQAKPIAEGIREEGFDEERLYIAKDINDALSYVYKITDVPSVVLLENDLPDNFL